MNRNASIATILSRLDANMLRTIKLLQQLQQIDKEGVNEYEYILSILLEGYYINCKLIVSLKEALDSINLKNVTLGDIDKEESIESENENVSLSETGSDKKIENVTLGDIEDIDNTELYRKVKVSCEYACEAKNVINELVERVDSLLKFLSTQNIQVSNKLNQQRELVKQGAIKPALKFSHDDIINLYKAGESVYAIAKRIGTSTATIYYHLKKEGLKGE